MTDWRPVNTAPRDGTDVLLRVPTFRRKVHIGRYRIVEHLTNGAQTYRREGWDVDGWFIGIEQVEPDGWLPLPDAGDPAAERKDAA